MALVPRDSLNELDRFRQRLGDFFADFPVLSEHSSGIEADVYETDKEVIATCNIPGIERKEDIQINVEKHTLHIYGTIHRYNEVKEEHMHQRERYTGTFQRSLPLPSAVSTENVKASYKNGVLEVKMLKREDEEKNKIDVDFN